MLATSNEVTITHIPIVGIYDRSFNNMSQVKVLSLANMVVLRTYMSVGLTS